MARTSTPWNLLPAEEFGCGSATTCWRRFDEWAKAGVFEQLQALLLDAPYEAGRRGAGWLKVKPVHTLDLVVLAAEWGHGRRRGWLSNLHLGARVQVRPELVVEVAFDGVQASPRYPGGLALRFARVLRYREDKPAEEADTIATVRAIHGGAPPRPER